MGDYREKAFGVRVGEAAWHLAGDCAMQEDEAVLWAHERITTLEATLRKTRWHVHGIFGASHPVIIAIDEVLSEAPARTEEVGS